MSGIQMVWFSNVGQKFDKKCLFCGFEYLVFNGQPNHLIKPFENQTQKVFIFQEFGIQIVPVHKHNHLKLFPEPEPDDWWGERRSFVVGSCYWTPIIEQSCCYQNCKKNLKQKVSI